MPTINQLVRENKRISKKTNLKKTPALECNPQKHGTCISVFTETPRKPNSALRKVAKVRLTNNRIIRVYIPGEGHNISRFSDILVSGRRIRDLPGVKYGAIRGKFDLASVQGKNNSRSKYGCKKIKPDFIEKNNKIRNREKKNRFYYKTFSKMFSLFLFDKFKTSDQKKYWLKAFFYFNLIFLNNRSKGFDFRGHFYQSFKGLLLYLYNYREDHANTYGKIKYPYKLLFVNRRLLIIKDLKTREVYSYNLKLNK
jgi:small subunit ribosomal protein S12